MATNIEIEEAFSRNRLAGEPIPGDVKILLGHPDELAERTGLRLNWHADWAPWLDTSYLAPEDRRNREIMANVRAIADVCGMIAFIAEAEDGECYGYWRGPQGAPISGAPLVRLDTEGQFEVCGATLADAILTSMPDDRLAWLRDWLRSIGIPVGADGPESIGYPGPDPHPMAVLQTSYRRHLGGGRSG